MDLKDAIYGRRSVRKYTDRSISDGDLNQILEAGTWAPSGVNLQPWYFVVCRSEASMAQLSKIMGGTIFGLTKVLNERFKSNPEVIDETLNFVKSMGGAKVCILTFLQRNNYDEELAAIESAAAAMQNIVLTAYAKGIASCWLTAPLHVEDELRAEFAPDKGRLIAAITLGYPAVEPRAPKRKEGRIRII